MLEVGCIIDTGSQNGDARRLDSFGRYTMQGIQQVVRVVIYAIHFAGFKHLWKRTLQYLSISKTYETPEGQRILSSST